MYCSKLFEGLDTRLNEKKDIDTIADELCNEIIKKRQKIINLIKMHKGGDYLKENAEWLGYDLKQLRNPTGRIKSATRKTKDEHTNKVGCVTRKPKEEEYDIWILSLEKWIKTLDDMQAEVLQMNEEITNTTEGRLKIKFTGLIKRIREIRMIFMNCK